MPERLCPTCNYPMYEPGGVLVAWACPLCGHVELVAGEPVVDATPLPRLILDADEADRQAEVSFARYGH